MSPKGDMAGKNHKWMSVIWVLKYWYGVLWKKKKGQVLEELEKLHNVDRKSLIRLLEMYWIVV